MSEILYLLEMMNGAEGISDIEGKATRVGASERGKRTSFNPERESFRNTDTVEDSQSQRGMNSAADILAKAR